MEAAGIEPGGWPLQPVDGRSVRQMATLGAANALHGSDAHWLELATVDPALLEVVQAWPSLPQHLRDTINVIVNANLQPPVS